MQNPLACSPAFGSSPCAKSAKGRAFIAPTARFSGSALPTFMAPLCQMLTLRPLFKRRQCTMVNGPVQHDMPHAVHRCGRCGSPAAFGFGPPAGQSGPRFWACREHRDAAEQRRAELFDRAPMQRADVPVQREPQAFPGGASRTGDLFGG